MNEKPSAGERSVFERMKTPEVVSEGERGLHLVSLLLKAENPEWEGEENDTSCQVTEFFAAQPLSPDFLERLGALREAGVDEESLYNLSLVYRHPERWKYVERTLLAHKSIEDLSVARDAVLDLLKEFDDLVSSAGFSEKFFASLERETSSFDCEKAKERIEKLLDFFQPNKKTTSLRTVRFVPSGPLIGRDSGRGFFLGDEWVVFAHPESADTQDHEFLHSIINPIVGKLDEQLSDADKKAISCMASERIREGYGSHSFSLLCEELIRTYNDVIKHNGGTDEYENFRNRLSRVSEEQFQKYREESSSFREHCEALGIRTMSDFAEKAREYFDRFEQSYPLREFLLWFYDEYMRERRRHSHRDFERFVLDNFQKHLHTFQ